MTSVPRSPGNTLTPPLFGRVSGVVAGTFVVAMLVAGCTPVESSAPDPSPDAVSSTTVSSSVVRSTDVSSTTSSSTVVAETDVSSTTAPTTSTSAVAPSTLGTAFFGSDRPTPEATVQPASGSWAGVTPPAGYRVVLISAGKDEATNAVVDAVHTWAANTDVELTTMAAVDDDHVERQINRAVAKKPDLVLGAGSGVVDVFSLLTAQNLAQQFLVIGAELPEPTGNVTSVVWPGANFRGTGLSAVDGQDDASFTPARTGDAITAGVASVLHGTTGIVINLG